MTKLTVRVAQIRREADDIVSFELRPEDGGALPAFEAGAHVDVLIPGQPARQYSLCNAPGETHRYLIAVLKEPASRGGSRYLHERLAEGDRLEISPPRNHFALHPGRRTLLIAGGIGVTPLLAMAETLAPQGLDWQFHYCSRSAARMAFAQRLAEPRFAGHVHLHLDDGPEAQRLQPATLLANYREGDLIYTCGPRGFLDWLRGEAAAAGWPEAAVQTEYFSGTVEHFENDGGFEIEIDGSGRIIPVGKDQTALDALIAAGIDVPNSCAEGVCGMCMTPVLQGTPDHRDQFLTLSERAENAYFMPCCSRAKSPRLLISCEY